MARIVCVCARQPLLQPRLTRSLEEIAPRLVPDNITAPPPWLVSHAGVSTMVVNPNPSVMTVPGAVCVGRLTRDRDRWNVPNTGVPDGTFALIRYDADSIEALTDVVGSRTIWYYHDDSLFMAATSQRALVSLLGTFELNPAAVSWMLSNGMLGPDQSWDRRIAAVPPDSRLRVDRARWSVTVETRPCVFSPAARTDDEHRAVLLSALRENMAALSFDRDRWAVMLSGGYDSRAILSLLPDPRGLRAVTWGTESALEHSAGDAVIARKVAAHFGIHHKYFVTDPSPEPLERVFQRFVANGEGRIDALSAYMDGFSIWKQLFEDGLHGLLRGDEGFGWHPAATPLEVLHINGLRRWPEFRNVRPLSDFGLSDPPLPAYLARRDGETLATWRDRLYHQYRMSVMHGALHDLKAGYVEVANPLVSRAILDVVRQLPDRLRTNKQLFGDVAREIGPPIPYATEVAIDRPRNILRSPRMVALLKDALSSSLVHDVLPKEFANYVLSRLESAPSITGTAARRFGPTWLKRFVKRTAGPMMDFNFVAFRCLLVGSAARMLTEDARVHSESASGVLEHVH